MVREGEVAGCRGEWGRLRVERAEYVKEDKSEEANADKGGDERVSPGLEEGVDFGVGGVGGVVADADGLANAEECRRRADSGLHCDGFSVRGLEFKDRGIGGTFVSAAGAVLQIGDAGGGFQTVSDEIPGAIEGVGGVDDQAGSEDGEEIWEEIGHWMAPWVWGMSDWEPV